MYGAARKYKQIYLESAPPARILDELLLRLVRDLDEAAQMIASNDLGGKGAKLSHALDILSELIGALDFTAAPEMCANLKKLYVFASERIVEANHRCAPDLLVAPRRILSDLREAYRTASDGAEESVP